MTQYTVKNPQLTLYAFHLRNDLSRGPRHPVTNADEIWEQLTELGQRLNCPELASLKTKLLCYQAGKYQPALEDAHPKNFAELLQPESILSFSVNLPHLRLTGELYPRLIHDTYAVELQLGYEGTLAASELGCLNPKNYLSPQSLKPSLGQTLLLIVEPTEDLSESDSQALAQTCVEALLPANYRPSLEEMGRLFDGLLFEYDTQHENPVERSHLLVWLKQENDPPPQASQYLLNLLNCQNKIKWAYYQSRYCNYEAQRLYSELRPAVSEFKESAGLSLQLLEELLKKLPHQAIDYANHLSDLEVQQGTIATNAENYKIWLEKLQLLTKPTDNLKFWQHFGEQECRRLQLQIQSNLNSLRPGLPLFQQIVDTIQGLTQIKTLNHEFNKQEQLEFIVVFIASTLESAAISAKVDFEHHLPDLFKEISHGGIFTTVIGHHFINMIPHLCVGLIFGAVAAFLLWIYQKIRH